jgi:hypothetical protein
MADFTPLRLMPLSAELLVSIDPTQPSPFSKLLPSESTSKDMTRHRAERINVDSDYLRYGRAKLEHKTSFKKGGVA